MEKTQIAAPAGWHEFLVELSEAAGGMVNGNLLSRKAKELLAAAAPVAVHQTCLDALTAARDFLASGKRDGEARLAVLCQVGTALTAAKDAPVAAAAPVAEPVAVRGCFNGTWFYGPWSGPWHAETDMTPEWEPLYAAPK